MAASTENDRIHSDWEKGRLAWKLKAVQKKMHSSILGSKSLKFVINSARRLGKSYLMVLMASEDAIRNKGCQLRFAAPTQKALKKIILPLMRNVYRDCPQNMRPKYNQIDGVFTFPNGSEIHMAGANSGHAESLRGTEALKAYVDEAGFVDDLKYLVDDILMPQLLTTRGQLVLSSTPPKTPAHDFVSFAEKADIDGHYAKYTIHEAGYSKELIDTFMREAGGASSTTWRREYLCEFVVDENYALAPEWSDGYAVPCDRPLEKYFQHLHRYVAMDIGIQDLTVVLFAYYDFIKAQLVIEDEICMNGPQMTTDKLAVAIKAKEKELWGDLPVQCRISDNNNLLLLQDLGTLHDLNFAPTTKDSLEAMVNNVRVEINKCRIKVNPKCKQLLGSLKFGVWKNNRKEFDRSSTFGHFDAFAALMYLLRVVDYQTNPIPPMIDIDTANTFVPVGYAEQNTNNQVVEAMLGLKRRR